MAQANMVRLNEASHRTLRQLAETLGESMQAVLAQAIEDYRRKQFFAQMDTSFAALRADETAWQEELTEREELSGTLLDDFIEAEVWREDGSVTNGG